MGSEAPARRIVVGLDGSEAAAAALRWAIALARSTGAEVVAVHAFQASHVARRATGLPMVPDLEAWATAEHRRFEQTWCAPLEESGVPHRTMFRAGHADVVLLEVADEVGADVVVTGRRGLSSLVELLAGSVSQHVLHRARCPVVVVPAARPAGEAAGAMASA